MCFWYSLQRFKRNIFNLILRNSCLYWPIGMKSYNLNVHIQLVVFNSWKCTIMQNVSHVFSKFHFTNEDFNWFFPHGYPNTRLMSWHIIWHNSRQRSYIVTNSLSLPYIVTNPLSFLWQEGSRELKTTMWGCISNNGIVKTIVNMNFRKSFVERKYKFGAPCSKYSNTPGLRGCLPVLVLANLHSSLGEKNSRLQTKQIFNRAFWHQFWCARANPINIG